MNSRRRRDSSDKLKHIQWCDISFVPRFGSFDKKTIEYLRRPLASNPFALRGMLDDTYIIIPVVYVAGYNCRKQ